MKTNPELRKEAKAFMAGNWKSAVIITLVNFLIITALELLNIGDSIVMKIIYVAGLIAVLLPLNYGYLMTFLRFSRGENLALENLFAMFKGDYYKKSIVLGLLVGVYTLLWTLLLIVPGFIKALSYALAPYIMIDNPELSAEEAICKSMKMMDGHKMDLFLIQLGFMGLGLLSILLLGIPFLWLMPYYQVVYAKFYEEIKNENRTPEAIAQV